MLTEAESSVTPVDTGFATKTDWFGKSKQSRFADKVVEANAQSEDFLIEREALRNLEPILSGQTKRQIKDITHPAKSAALFRKAAEVKRYLQ